MFCESNRWYQHCADLSQAKARRGSWSMSRSYSCLAPYHRVLKSFSFHCWRTWSQIVGRDGFGGGGWFVFSFLYRACSIKTLPTALISFLPASSLPSPLLVLCLLFLFLNMIGKWEEEVLLSVHTAVSRPSYGVSRALVVRLGLGV